MSDDLGSSRRQYERAQLDETSVQSDPFNQFELWLREAREQKFREPNAMTLATADAQGRPSARIVLLRGYDDRGFVFYSNYASRKGAELAENPNAALLFYWDALERELRIEGRCERIAAEDSDDYFAQRPPGHRISAWASRQSSIVPDRAYLEGQMREFAAKFAAGVIPRPAYWGGYRLAPLRFEFWQGRRDRVHDRIRYERSGDGWRIERLAP